MKRFYLIAITVLTSQALADTQTIPLVAGWNAISFQVAPTNSAPSSVFGPLGNNFTEAYTFNNVTKQFYGYFNPAQAGGATLNALPAAAMGQIQPGLGYLVKMQNAATLTVTGTTPASTSIATTPGQNLVGFPLPSGTLGPVGLQDVLSGSAYNFNSANEFAGPGYLSFSNNGIVDDKTYLLNPNKAYWIELTDPNPLTFVPSVASKPPLLFVERSEPFVVEAPITGFGGTSIVNLPLRLTRTYNGKIGFLVTGTAHPNTDFAITTVTTPVSPTNSIGEITVSSAAMTYQIPVIIKEKSRLQTNVSVFATLRRPVETPAAQDSGTLPQVAHIKITDGMNGIYEGFLKGTSATATLNGQNFRVALRANGQAIFDPADGGMISSRFSLPYTLSAGVPQFTGSASVFISSADALKRNVTVTIAPSATVSLPAGANSTLAFDLPFTITFTNLTAAGPFQTTAKMTLTQSAPALQP